MTTRTVISRGKIPKRSENRKFIFTRDMVPGLEGNGKTPEFLREYRARAWDEFQSQPLPTTQDEPWRRTDLRNLSVGSLYIPSKSGTTSRKKPGLPKELLKPMSGHAYFGRALLDLDKPMITLDPDLSRKGVIFTDLRTAEKEYPDILKNILGKIIDPGDGKFAALAGALAQTGILLYVPPFIQIEKPLHSILWKPGVNLAHLSHILVWVDQGASLTYIHESASPTEISGQSLHAGLVEINVGPSANLRFVELQSWGQHVWNFTHEKVRLERDANLDWIFGSTGSLVSKIFSEIELSGEGAKGTMSGFYFTDGVQHMDHDTQQNHLAPNTTSDLIFKGALRGRSRSVWQGMIYVAPGAQKTDGYQANRNLILSPNARADSIPGLEILADDVRCTHAATVGKIDEDQLFYLRSRGIPPREAARLIVEGFFEPIMQRIPFEGIRARFREQIAQKMD